MRKQVTITLHSYFESLMSGKNRSRTIELALCKLYGIEPHTLLSGNHESIMPAQPATETPATETPATETPAAPKPVTQQPAQMTPASPETEKPRREDYDDEADYYQDLGEWQETYGDHP